MASRKASRNRFCLLFREIGASERLDKAVGIKSRDAHSRNPRRLGAVHRQADPLCTVVPSTRSAPAAASSLTLLGAFNGLDAVTDLFSRHLFFVPKIGDQASAASASQAGR